MSNVLEDSLFVSQNKKFDEIQSIVRQFSAEYVGNSIIKDNIFAVICDFYDSAGGWQRGCVFGTGGSNDSASMVHIRR